MTLLTVDALQVQMAGKTCVADLSLDVQAGELLALIGPNGAGKSTVLRAIAQLLPYSGQVFMQGQNLATLDIFTLNTAQQDTTVLTRTAFVQQLTEHFNAGTG